MNIAKKWLFLALALSLPLQAQQYNQTFPAIVMTGTGQTSSTILLSRASQATGGAFSLGTITVSGVSLATATFSVLGSSDGGQTFYPLNINSVTSPSTVATTETVTANGLYQVNLAGITAIEFVTSGTFTATSVSFTLTASPNGIIARAGGGGGGSGTVTSVGVGTWPSWLTPTITAATTTPSIAVTSSAIPNSALANPSTTVNGQTCTLGSSCTIAGTVYPSVQITVGTTAVPANSCLPSATTYYTATMTGLTSAMTVSFTWSADYHAVTGWSPAGATLYFTSYPTANTLNYQVCNNSPASITPSAPTVWNVSAQ